VVQRLLRGRLEGEKLSWLVSHGEVIFVEMSATLARPDYRFESALGFRCAFFFDEAEFGFFGDHTPDMVGR